MAKKIFTVRVIILLITLLLMLIAISPNPFASGIQVKSARGEVAENGLRINDFIESINGKKVSNIDDFNSLIEEEYKENSTFVIKTSGGEVAYIALEKPEIIVKEAKKTNIEVGLDLSGGTRVVLEPSTTKQVTSKQINDVIDVLNNRLNVYGLSDLQIRAAEGKDGKKLIVIEIAGATRQEVRELIEQQGEFEAKIGNETVFIGSKNDIPFVCKDDGTCSGIRSCDPSNGGYTCRFEFSINLSPVAAKKHAQITKDLAVNQSNIDAGKRYLSKPLSLYLDDKLVDELLIGEDLKGKESTAIAISGPGSGITQEEAYNDALKNMNKLQTVLITGSLPFKLDIVKIDSISPTLGSNFIYNTLWVSILAMILVSLVIYLRYRKLRITIPIIITMVSEILIILGIAALIRWRLDLVSIAGIIATVGTGVNDQIVITDELLKGSKEFVYNWKEKTKRAFFIIFSAYATLVAAMIPLWFAGAGLLRGFAVTTIIGITAGVFITRPAYASIIERLLRE
ncbi:protein translocase subunit SecD [Candidatus Woesearchaeota archaeon]|nr:protein translocase subunit SecD [Candidatus Woesearchaeota archaeon]